MTILVLFSGKVQDEKEIPHADFLLNLVPADFPKSNFTLSFQHELDAFYQP